MCSLLAARYAVVHQNLFFELDHCEVNVITDQHCDLLNLPEIPWFFIVSNGFFFCGFLFRPSNFFDYADPLLVTSSESPHVIAVLHQRRASTTLSYNTSKSQYSTVYSDAAQNLNLPNSEASPGRSR